MATAVLRQERAGVYMLHNDDTRRRPNAEKRRSLAGKAQIVEADGTKGAFSSSVQSQAGRQPPASCLQLHRLTLLIPASVPAAVLHRTGPPLAYCWRRVHALQIWYV